MSAATSIAETIISHLKKEGQYDMLPAVVDVLQKEVFRSKTITIISAAPLEDKDETALKKMLFEKWGEHELAMTVDPTLLSGLIIRFQDQLIDMSGKNSLNQLAHALK